MLEAAHRRGAFSCGRRDGDLKGEEFGLGQDKEKTTPAAGPSADVGDDREVGSALRSVYQRTVSEKVPDDLLDLLGKLT